jgi:hypothetical protein
MTPPIPNITPEEALERLRTIHLEQQNHGQGYRDIEGDHSEADRILCELLQSLGYGAIVHEWNQIYKWYA